jgi:hypothetical protein
VDNTSSPPAIVCYKSIVTEIPHGAGFATTPYTSWKFFSAGTNQRRILQYVFKVVGLKSRDHGSGLNKYYVSDNSDLVENEIELFEH